MKWPCQQIDPALPPGRDWPIGCQRQNTPLCTASSAGGRHPITAPNGGSVRASIDSSHQVVALATTGQLGMAAARKIRLAVVKAQPR
jgi:hypothetical protein